MSISTIGYVEVKSALKDALVELLQERRDLFHDMFKDIVKEINFAEKANLAAKSTSESDLDDEFERTVETEIHAFHSMHSGLVEQHSGEFVAIYDQQLVDHDTDKLALYQRVHETYPEQFVLMRRVEEAPEPELYFRSTRFFIPSS